MVTVQPHSLRRDVAHNLAIVGATTPPPASGFQSVLSHAFVPPAHVATTEFPEIAFAASAHFAPSTISTLLPGSFASAGRSHSGRGAGPQAPLRNPVGHRSNDLAAVLRGPPDFLEGELAIGVAVVPDPLGIRASASFGRSFR